MNTTAHSHSHFTTKHLEGDLKGRAVRGGMLTVTSQAVSFGFRLGSTAILARLLLPTDFGIVAMATAFVGVIYIFKDAGLSMATIQKKNISHEQISNLFWVNLSISLCLMVITAIISPAIAWFFNEPRLIGVTLSIATTFIFAGLTAQHLALLRRKMRFLALACTDILALIVGIIVAIGFALHDTQYWALVAMEVTISFTTVVLVWFFCAWRPSPPFRSSGIRSMLAFGGNLTGARMFDALSRHFDRILIGFFCGAGPLGFYTRAYKLLLMPIQQINFPLGQVALPVLSRLQDNPKRFRLFYCKGILFSVTIGMPLVAFAFVAAHDLVLLFLGNQWGQAVPFFRALAPAAFFGTFNLATGWVFVPLGMTDKQFRASFYGMIVTAIALVIGIKWGALGVAVAFSISRIFIRLPQIMYAFHGTPLRLKDLGSALWRPAVSSISAGLLVELLEPGLHFVNLFASIFIDATVFFAAYSLVWLLMPRGFDTFVEMVNTIKSVRTKAA